MNNKNNDKRWRKVYSIGIMLFFSFLFVACGTINPITGGRGYPNPSSNPGVTAVGLPASSASPQLGIVLDQGGVILYIDPRYSAAQSTLKLGDKITRINNITIAEDPVAIRQFLSTIGPGDIVPVEIDDNGETKTIQVTIAPYPQVQDGQTDSPLPTATPVLEPYQYF